jgi:hypothetical protein
LVYSTRPTADTLTLITKLTDAGMPKDQQDRSAYRTAYRDYIDQLMAIDEHAANIDVLADQPTRTKEQAELVDLRARVHDAKQVLDFLAPDEDERKRIGSEIATYALNDKVARLDKLIRECKSFLKWHCGRPDLTHDFLRAEAKPMFNVRDKAVVCFRSLVKCQ